ncbi:MAG: AarF/ABC1/UbiB kinase family protein [Hyphomicrobiales bacterium]|nr:AarF/ABC1/UbiB kinase family protein [Hyphomicrobiales bacterium]
MTDQLPPSDDEANRFSRRLRRYTQVGTNVGGVAAGMATRYVLGMAGGREKNAAALAEALGGMKGPLMKVAQLLSTIPDALPPEYAEELSKLQAAAPPMGWVFVKRRMAAELGAEWQDKFGSFERESAASASLGQVHRAFAPDGSPLACKLQYPDMESAVEADMNQLRMVLAVQRRIEPAVDTSEIPDEIGARLREELDYRQEAQHMALYKTIFEAEPSIRVPGVRHELSTRRLLTMDWMEGGRLLDFKTREQDERNIITAALFKAWWYPFSHCGVIHGDPHLGNYTIFEENGRAAGINLLDYGCVRTFAPRFVQGVIDLYHGLLRDDRELIVHAYETWGFNNLSNDLIEVLNLWARFIYGPLLDDRVRRIAEGVPPSQYGRKEAFAVKRGLKEKGPVKVPREFVFMDRAAIGLGAVFLHLDAEMNFYRLFNETIEDFDIGLLEARQKQTFEATGVPLPMGRS